jgi:bis(5'-adenosyl)-triphosphatase
MSHCNGDATCKADGAKRIGEDIMFANFHVGASNVLLSPPSMLTVAIVQLSQIVQGHTIIAPQRHAARLADLTNDELCDFWQTARTAQGMLQRHYSPTAFNLALLDGAGAGQPVPHVHAHLVPRFHADTLVDDRVHGAIQDWSPEPPNRERREFHGPSEEDRKPRDAVIMAAEASRYRTASASFNENIKFAKFDIASSSVFYKSSSDLTLAFVNLKPLVPGHVLVVPRRVVPRLEDLNDEELKDLFISVREVQAVVCKEHGADSASIGIQDGEDAGQSVPHVHVHILPQHSGKLQ